MIKRKINRTLLLTIISLLLLSAACGGKNKSSEHDNDSTDSSAQSHDSSPAKIKLTDNPVNEVPTTKPAIKPTTKPVSTHPTHQIQLPPAAANAARVQFDKGSASTTLRGTLTGSPLWFVLRAKQGQLFTVRTDSVGVGFDIVSPQSELFDSNHQDWSFNVDNSGDYRIKIFARNRSAVSVNYAVEVSIR